MQRIIENVWRPLKPGLERAQVVQHTDVPEGLNVSRYRCQAQCDLSLDDQAGHMLSVPQGQAHFQSREHSLALSSGSNMYIPPGAGAAFTLQPNTELIVVSSGQPKQAVGTQVVLRHERFLAACAIKGHALRWILTPQYLSRRIFLHHDAPMRSRAGRPVSWFHTTMFDVGGLALNQDQEPVFKMSYDTRTEFNVCYDVQGKSRVRMAEHPYVSPGQKWLPWCRLHSDATYHLNETNEGFDRVHRNRHEVAIEGGYVSLFCTFDPAPTGMERHRPGEYSDYEPLELVQQRPEYAQHIRSMRVFDEMVEVLSMAQATGQLESQKGSTHWKVYEEGRIAQLEFEQAMKDKLRSEGAGRDLILAKWMCPKRAGPTP